MVTRFSLELGRRRIRRAESCQCHLARISPNDLDFLGQIDDGSLMVKFAETINGRTSMLLTLADIAPEEAVADRIRRIDGRSFFSYSVWRLPSGVESIEDIDREAWPEEYLQVAGSEAGFTAEIRRLTDGIPVQSTIGRITSESDSQNCSVQWDGTTTTVRENELLSADEVIDIFCFYLSNCSVRGVRYSLRSVELKE